MNGIDLLVAIGVAVASAAFVLSFPHYLGASDEGLILYEAKRLLAGDVYFRDLFEIIPPGCQYVVAGAFWLFGTTVTTARGVDAAVHALITALVYACGRATGVRRPLAAIAALLDPVLLWPAWPYVSPHWMSTALGLLLLWVCLRRPWDRRPAAAAAPGLVLGLLALVQHQRAVPFAIGVGGLLVLDALVGVRFGERLTVAAVAARAAACAAAAVVVAAPPFLALIAEAGIGPVVRDLVTFPLVNYHSAYSARWGQTWMIDPQFAMATSPVLLRWAPVALLVVAAIGAARWWRRDRLRDVRIALVIAVIGAAQVAAILYFPDLIHLAFAAPVCAVAAAVVIEWTLRSLAGVPRATTAAAAPAAVLVALLGWRAAELRTRAWARVAMSAPTAFGSIDFDDANLSRLVAAVIERANKDPQRRLLCYPGYPAIYLMTDTRNPTPFQLLIPGYNASDQLAIARDLVDRARVPLVVIVYPFVRPHDEFVQAVKQRYRPVPDQPLLWELPAAGAAPSGSASS